MQANMPYLILLILTLSTSCDDNNESPNEDLTVEGFELLRELSGHWVGSNETVFGDYDWFAFDFRPISASHVHSIYEGGTNQNIITSVFLADYDGKQQIMARNGGWLGNQYRATYFLLDKAQKNGSENYYRLVDAVGGEKRAYMEFRINGDEIKIDAYKDNSGSLDEPIHHMGFKGSNRNPSYAESAVSQFGFPKSISEVDLTTAFDVLIDPDSALFLEENLDPFPKAQHGYLSDVIIQLRRQEDIANRPLLLYLSKSSLVSSDGNIDLNNINDSVTRTIDIQSNEESYTTTYVHPDEYFLTAFFDQDGNGFPSTGDISSISMAHLVLPESTSSSSLNINVILQ